MLVTKNVPLSWFSLFEKEKSRSKILLESQCAYHWRWHIAVSTEIEGWTSRNLRNLRHTPLLVWSCPYVGIISSGEFLETGHSLTTHLPDASHSRTPHRRTHVPSTGRGNQDQHCQSEILYPSQYNILCTRHYHLHKYSKIITSFLSKTKLIQRNIYLICERISYLLLNQTMQTLHTHMLLWY